MLALLCSVQLLPSAFAADASASLDGRTLIPVGKAVGMRIAADGVLVVGLSDVESDGKTVSPAKDAGLKEGDLITAVGAEDIDSTQELKDALSDGKTVEISFERDGTARKTSLLPVKSDADGDYKLGAWVRDSLAGIGTITYYDPDSGAFGALGHGINDSQTATLLPIAEGTLIRASVASVKRGEAGSPGELTGDFDVTDEFGSLERNTERGVFGSVDAENLGITLGEPLTLASSAEIQEGSATILANVSGDAIERYEIEIEKVSRDGSTAPRDMLIRITDERLLAATGGIVQGMSGSPIIQNGKLVGAVTHVLIGDPTRGYGIFIEDMLAAAE